MKVSPTNVRPVAQPLVSLEQIFGGSLFRIPDYQRGFSWNEKEYGVFWDDLCRMGSSRIHYTGQITVREVPEEEYSLWPDERPLLREQKVIAYYVVDGQQRLTTAIILLKCLTDRMGDEDLLMGLTKIEIEQKYLYHHTGQLSRIFLFGYSVGGACYEYFKEHVLGQKSIETHQANSLYAMNLREAREYFTSRLSELSHETLQTVFEALTTRLRFNWSELVPELDEFVVFETMNNRGKKASDFELLKNRLIHLSSLLPDTVSRTDRDRLRKHINTAWASAYEELGRSRDGTLNDDKLFLFNHTFMFFNRTWEVTKFLFDEHFTQDRVLDGKIDLNSLESYVTSIPSSARAWRFIHDPHDSIDLHDQTRGELVRLQRISHGAFVPLLMAVLQSQSTDPSSIHSLIRAVETFRFAVGAICRRKSNTGDSHFFNLAFRVFLKYQTIDGAKQEIDHWTSNHFHLDRAISEFENRFRWQKGFYSWHHLRFLLFEYEQEVRREVGLSYTKLNWEEFNAEQRSDFVTVEHILPDKPRQGEWSSFGHFEEDQIHRLTHSLGNLLPLSQSRNSHLSNRAFRVKCGDDGKVRGYSEGSCCEIKVSKRPDWTPLEIVNRGLDILVFMEARWGLDFGTRQQRLRFLGLEFMGENLSPEQHQSPDAGSVG
jgi:hypothetical protein